MLELPEIEKALNKFVDYVVTESKKNAPKASGKLAKTIDGDVKVTKNAIDVTIIGEDYLEFIDKGVRGAGGVRKTTSKFKRTNNKGKLWKIKAKDSPFKFGKSGGISPRHFTAWARQKGLSPFAVAKAVYHQGIETTNFFTTPFEEAFKKLPEELVEAFGLDVEDFMDFALNENREK
jgi:hypothetical protein